ncbi:MAG: hypothetical protein H8E41_10985 [Desulfobulbaceae bacterium]|uniref:Uncharacterized protein n=1 Tax=Candidatus Desulfobia pelagia TaxID=2841692 RepID=A0A8J6NFG3_9BACT|nr:hypothetical protein [Candidatus Desulfobia pelagia]
METIGSLLKIGNIILFLIVFMALVLIPMRRQRKEIRQLREQTEMLLRAIERLEFEQDVYNPANQQDLAEKSNLVTVNHEHIQ